MKLSISFRQISFLLISLFLLMILGFSRVAYAEDQPVGQMIWVKGNVKAAQPGGSARSLERRSAIFEHDVIDTASGSTGEVGFTDTSVVTLRESTEFKIDEYKYDKNGSSSKSVMSIIKGGLRTITGFIPKQNPDAYQMKTPVATIGVRGTEYSVVMSGGQLLLKIDKGIIQAKNDAGLIELQKCDDAVRCKLYAVVGGYDMAPRAVAKMPVQFNNDPPVSAHPDMGAPLMPGQTGAPAGGPPKTVKSFCVGLLKGIYHNTFGWLFEKESA